MKIIEIGSVFVDEISVDDGLRDVDADWVAVIAATMSAVGQLQDIVVRRVGSDLQLVAGAHRLAAARQLGWPSIQAKVVEIDDTDETRELAAIENVARRELTALDKAIHLGTLRDIHQKRNPAARRTGDRKKQQEAQAERGQVQVLHFDAAVTEKLRLSRRSIYNYLGLYDRLAPKVREQIKGTALADNFTELQALAHEKPEEQVAILTLVTGPEPKATSIAQAASIHHNDIDTSTPDERDFARFVKLWARASKKLRKQIIAHTAKEQ